MKQSIGNFLLRRLHEAGIRHIFGVPGDYNLEFMQQLEDRGDPAWIGTCNELNGSYAADGYARMAEKLRLEMEREKDDLIRDKAILLQELQHRIAKSDERPGCTGCLGIDAQRPQTRDRRQHRDGLIIDQPRRGPVPPLWSP